MTRLLTPEEFGQTFDPPKRMVTIRQRCQQGRIPTAIKKGGIWLIPENAQIVGKGIRIEYGKNKGLSVKEYADMHGRSAARVYKLLSQNRIEGAKHGPHGWDIPEDAPWPADDGF
jgi:hypothetical protein